MRVGHGYDVHEFIEGRPMILGGVNIPSEKGLEAHSDGDAVIHALCDALLGAAALGDIGSYFPDTDKGFKNIDSRILLRKIIELVKNNTYTLCNADITVIAQTPKMAPFISAMRACLAEDLQTNINAINVKATTTEKLGYIGREEGIAVHAIVIIEKVGSK